MSLPSSSVAASSAPLSSPALAAAVAEALSRIAPLWPLRHWVAVNPFVGLVDRPFEEACALLERTTGAAPVQSPAAYLDAFRRGEIEGEDLAAVADGGWTVERLLAALTEADAGVEAWPVATVADLLDRREARAHWQTFLVGEISRLAASVFDENQLTWRSPWADLGLFKAWRETARRDRTAEAFGLRGFRRVVAGLPDEADDAIAAVMHRIAPPSVDVADFLHRELVTVSGWAGYLQYLVREDALRGRTNPALRELLAVRLAYDLALYVAFVEGRPLERDWRGQREPGGAPVALGALVRWQSAYENGYRRRLARAVAAQPASGPGARPPAQAVFCIDVRSEVFRRALEAELPGVQTVGFAGFFGFPVSHSLPARPGAASRCPVLLVPPVASHEALSGEELEARAGQAREVGAWKAFQNSAVSCFTFVEAGGLASAPPLVRAGPREMPRCEAAAPRLEGLAVAARADLAAGALRGMGLTRTLARVVLLCGHGSQSANNPYASALDCGACGGHAGDVNARLAAATLNDPAVRTELKRRGLEIPPDTLFLAGLHQTTADDVQLFDVERIPPNHRDDVARLATALVAAGRRARAERATALGLGHLQGEALDRAVRRRATDISQVRPEWGLANNAALIAAPRARTRALRLEGRVFLHDYDAATDSGGGILTLILTAPVVVASWINLQYYASRVDPERYGAGSKVLHNVLGGLGVVEGNGGDLRVGLPLQSIHDGETFVHEPRRLSVLIEAKRDAIGAVLTAHPAVRALFDHAWIHLVAIEGDQAFAYRGGAWQRL
jgi:uncharacterized protein YbcC (UPF0753/DUF2309 family)